MSIFLYIKIVSIVKKERKIKNDTKIGKISREISMPLTDLGVKQSFDLNQKNT